MTNDQIKNNINYIKVLLALGGHSDAELIETLDWAIEKAEQKSPCGIECGTDAINAENARFVSDF